LGWPRKNTPQQIRERQARLRQLAGWRPDSEVVFDSPSPLESYAPLVEAVTATVALPVSVVGPMPVDLGHYRAPARSVVAARA